MNNRSRRRIGHQPGWTTKTLHVDRFLHIFESSRGRSLGIVELLLWNRHVFSESENDLSLTGFVKHDISIAA